MLNKTISSSGPGYIEVDDTQSASLPEDNVNLINNGGHVEHFDSTTHYGAIIPLKHKPVFDMILQTMDYKGSHYVREPLDYIDPITILHIVKLKVERALQVKHIDKQIDDIKDLCVYGLRLLGRAIEIRNNQMRMNQKINANRIIETNIGEDKP